MGDESLQVEWFLEGFGAEGKKLRRWTLKPLPYRIGRKPDSDLCLPYASVSGDHAEIFQKDGALWVRDLNTVNGTFLNRHRIDSEAALDEGDILHFSEYEFRLGRLLQVDSDPETTVDLLLSEETLSENLVTGVRQFRELLQTHAVLSFFQPVVRIGTQEPVGYEILGRGNLEGLSSSPSQLFRIADSLGLEQELSRMFRLRGIQEARGLEGDPLVFLNTHPTELETVTMIELIEEVRSRAPELPVILEVHESTVSDLDQMRVLRQKLTELNMGLAYDDFGAGQARLLELVEVPPDYLKFDQSLIRDIDRAPAAHQKVLESLCRVVLELGIPCVAEGVETVEETEVCRQMGFEFAQGFLFGEPAPLSHWSA